MDDAATRNAHPTADTFGRLDTSTHRLVMELAWALAGLGAAHVVARLVTGRVLGLGSSTGDQVLTALVDVVISAVALYITSARPLRRDLTEQRRLVEDSQRTMERRVDQQTFLSNVHDALEMGTTEADAVEVLGLAMAEASDAPTELLVADSSRAHLQRAVAATGRDEPGCGVASPWDCPAVRRGQLLRFEDSSALGACPRLRDRSDRFGSAVCVPVNILGTPTAVVHSARLERGPWDRQSLDRLDGVASQAGARLGVLRAMAKSQLQAETDPLTGLLNRRAMEEKFRAIRASGTSYAVALADLDKFKQLNDRHGHETGDRALRTFARVLSESVRSSDVVSRHGGEEFVVVLPGLTGDEAEQVLQRVRDELRSAIGTALPPFTVSMGVADSTYSTELPDLLRVADRALMQAKADGRNRIVVSPACQPDGADSCLLDLPVA